MQFGFGVPNGVDHYSPRNSSHFLFVLFCALKTWLCFLPDWGKLVISSSIFRHPSLPVRGPKDVARQKCGLLSICDQIWLEKNVGHTLFVAGALLTVARSGGLFKSFFSISSGEALDAGKTVIFCTMVGGCLFHTWGHLLLPGIFTICTH